MSPKSHRTAVVAAALTLYVASLFTPAMTYLTHVSPDHVAGKVETVSGWFFAGFGWIGVLFLQPAAMGWLANITFLPAIGFHAEGRHVRSMILSGASLVIAVIFFWVSVSEPMPVLFSGLNDAMNRPKALIGFYLWIAAFATCFLASMASVWKHFAADATPRLD
jgi:hypothetical protein